jgi:hypothetical protein
LTLFLTLGSSVNPGERPKWLSQELLSVIQTPGSTICEQLSRTSKPHGLKGITVLPLCYILSEESTPLRRIFLFLAYLEAIHSHCATEARLPKAGDHHTFVDTAVKGFIPQIKFLSHDISLNDNSAPSGTAREFVSSVFSMLPNFFPTLGYENTSQRQQQDIFAEQWTTGEAATNFLTPLRELIANGLDLALSNLETTLQTLGGCTKLLQPVIQELQSSHFIFGVIRHKGASFRHRSMEPQLSFEDEKEDNSIEETFIDMTHLLLNNDSKERFVFSLGVTRAPLLSPALVSTNRDTRAYGLEPGFLPTNGTGSNNRHKALIERFKLLFTVCEACGDNPCLNQSHSLLLDTNEDEPGALDQIKLLDSSLKGKPLSASVFRAALLHCVRKEQRKPGELRPRQHKNSWNSLQARAEKARAATRAKTTKRTLNLELAAVAEVKAAGEDEEETETDSDTIPLPAFSDGEQKSVSPPPTGAKAKAEAEALAVVRSQESKRVAIAGLKANLATPKASG